MVDFSTATPGPDGSWCITKVVLKRNQFVYNKNEIIIQILFAQVKYVDHMEQDQVKECWHQNVTQCHDTYITEFLPRSI